MKKIRRGKGETFVYFWQRRRRGFIGIRVGQTHAWVIVGDTGRVVPPRDSNALAQAWLELAGLSSSSRRALGAAGRSRITAHFSMSAIAARYEELYDEMLSSKSPKGARQCAA